MYSLGALVLSSFLLTQVTATATPASSRRPIHLLARQTDTTLDPSDVPAQCQTQCSAFVTAVNSCSTSTVDTCGCTTQTENSIVTCFNCVITISPSSQSSAEQLLDNFISACNTGGAPLPPASLNGVTGSGGSSSPSSGDDNPSSSEDSPSPVGTGTGSSTSPSTGGSSGGESNSPGGALNPFAKKGAASKRSVQVGAATIGLAAVLACML